jgi:hypothetical protein
MDNIQKPNTCIIRKIKSRVSITSMKSSVGQKSDIERKSLSVCLLMFSII